MEDMNMSNSRTHFDMNQQLEEFERHSTRDETMRPSTTTMAMGENKTVRKSDNKKVMFSEVEKQKKKKDQHDFKPQIYNSTKSDSEDSSYGEHHQPVTIISMSESEDESNTLHQYQYQHQQPHSIKIQDYSKISTSNNQSNSNSNMFNQTQATNKMKEDEQPPSILDEAFVQTPSSKTEQSQSHLSNTSKHERGIGIGRGRGRGRGEIRRREHHNEGADVKETSYSLIPESSNVLDSPASRHLITQFEKFLVKEIIGKSQRDEDVKTIGTIPTPAVSIPAAQSKSKTSTDSDFNVKSILNPNNESSVSINKFRAFSSTVRGERQDNGTNNSISRKNVQLIDPPKILAQGAVQCRFAHSGCTELLEKGSIYEQDHYQNCKFRPLQCILMPSCTEIIPYHDYIPHLMKHFLVPIYESEITSSVILTRTDFSKEQQYRPKWFSAQNFHFFTMIQRTAEMGYGGGGGVWKAWVWMLGSKEEADEFAARITFTKGLKSVSEVFPVHSIRVAVEDIEVERTCLLVKDETMIELTNMKENVFTDFELNVKLIPHAKNLNSTTRQLRSLGNQYSRRLISEQGYVPAINKEEQEEEET